MTFLEQLQAHKGGLLRLKTQLYWYDGVRNEIVGRICLLLDAAAATTVVAAAASAAGRSSPCCSAALLLIDGSPQWIWIAVQDVELL